MDIRDREAGTLPPDESQGPMLMGSVLPLFGLALIVYAIRIWSRLRPKYNMTAADYAITIAMVTEQGGLFFFWPLPPTYRRGHADLLHPRHLGIKGYLHRIHDQRDTTRLRQT